MNGGKLDDTEFISAKEVTCSMENNAESVNRGLHLRARISTENSNNVRFKFH